MNCLPLKREVSDPKFPGFSRKTLGGSAKGKNLKSGTRG